MQQAQSIMPPPDEADDSAGSQAAADRGSQAGPSGISSYPLSSPPSPTWHQQQSTPFQQPDSQATPGKDSSRDDHGSGDESSEGEGPWRQEEGPLDPATFPRIIAAEAHSRPEEDWYAATVFVDLIAFVYTVVRYQVTVQPCAASCCILQIAAHAHHAQVLSAVATPAGGQSWP